jgi:DNA-binding transcriptional MocR family regulator
VNVFSLLNHFFREDEREKVSSSATKLYFFLIYEANKSYWEGPLMFSERKLSSLLSFSKNTVSKSLSELEDRGLIMCYPRKGNGLTANEEDGLTANVEGKGAFSSTFWFPEVQLRKAASSAPKGVQGKPASSAPKGVQGKPASSAPKGVQGKPASSAPKGVQGKTASQKMRAEKKDVYNKGGSKYAKFF